MGAAAGGMEGCGGGMWGGVAELWRIGVGDREQGREGASGRGGKGVCLDAKTRL